MDDQARERERGQVSGREGGSGPSFKSSTSACGALRPVMMPHRSGDATYVPMRRSGEPFTISRKSADEKQGCRD